LRATSAGCANLQRHFTRHHEIDVLSDIALTKNNIAFVQVPNLSNAGDLLQVHGADVVQKANFP
jgi:hypothetical protein